MITILLLIFGIFIIYSNYKQELRDIIEEERTKCRMGGKHDWKYGYYKQKSKKVRIFIDDWDYTHCTKCGTNDYHGSSYL